LPNWIEAFKKIISTISHVSSPRSLTNACSLPLGKTGNGLRTLNTCNVPLPVNCPDKRASPVARADAQILLQSRPIPFD
ncbi:hypothetical protein, partial [Ruegeria atlantica]|uniref:hypothetical protein n=1 Tax=Ruegeria atlantica TaxID=81569 RepID=UPI002494936C